MKILTIVFNGSEYEFTHRGQERTASDFFELRRKAKRLGYTDYMYQDEGWVYPFSKPFGGRA